VTLAHLYRHTATFQRKAATRDSSGGAVENYAAVEALADVPCLIQTHHGKAARQLGERQVIVSHVLYLDSVDGVRRGDRVYQAATGLYFHVVGFGDMAGQGVVARVELALVT
jgi:head-tail adaptor